MLAQLNADAKAFDQRIDQLDRTLDETATEISRCQAEVVATAALSQHHPQSVPSLAQRLAQFVSAQGKLPSAFSDLIQLGVSAMTVVTLQPLVKQGHREDDVVIAWLTEQTNAQSPGIAVDERLKTRLARAAQQGLRKLVRALFP